MVNSVPTFVLFDCGATHFFVSCRFTKALKFSPVYLKETYRVYVPNERVLVSNLLHQGYRVEIGNEELSANLTQTNMVDFDIILRMDCLSKNYALVGCRGKHTYFGILGLDVFSFQGFARDKGKLSRPIISTVRTRKCI